MEGAVVVYIRGYGAEEYLWYRMEVDNKRIRDGDGRRERIKFQRVGELVRQESGFGGGWAVIGEEEDIYWIGGFTDEEGRHYGCLDVLKHNFRNPNPTHWEKVSPRKIPRVSPVVAAVSGGKKLCVVSGYEQFLPKPNHDEATLSTYDRWKSYSWTKAGEIYDPDTDSWTYLQAPMEPFRDYTSETAALAVDKDQILFHGRGDDGSVLYCDLGSDVYISDLDFFGSWPIEDPPPGLQGCPDLDILHIRSRNSRPVLYNDTFYWFTYDLRLFAYDINLESWFRSHSLADLLHPLKPPTNTIFLCPAISILLGLPNGELLVIVQEDDVPAPRDARHLTLASLAVLRDGEHSLKVSLGFFQPFSVDDPFFVLHDGKAMLKNTR